MATAEYHREWHKSHPGKRAEYQRRWLEGVGAGYRAAYNESRRTGVREFGIECICDHCGEVFMARNANAKTCSRLCAAYNQDPTGEKRRAKDRAKTQALRARLIGEGPIKFDPVNGQDYDCRSGKPKPAREWTCVECEASWKASRYVWRHASGVCATCRRQQAVAGRTMPEGSTHRDDGGYIRIKVGAEWVQQHRIVMQELLGRPLGRDESVHHINGDRADNRPENLQLRRSYHGKGQAHTCLDCGSHNIAAVPLAQEVLA